MMELDEDDRKKLLKEMPSETIAKEYIDHLDTDDAVDLIRDLDEEAQEEVLSHINDAEQAGDIVDLLKYDENTAGGLMGTEMVIVNRKLEYARVYEGNASSSRRHGRNILRVCGRR